MAASSKKKYALKKLTVPALVKEVADVLGMDEGSALNAARRLRESGYLSQEGHGRGAAAATSKDAALLVSTLMQNVSSIYIADVARGLLSLRPDPEGVADGPHFDLGKDPVAALAKVLDYERSGAQPYDEAYLQIPVHPGGGLFVKFEFFCGDKRPFLTYTMAGRRDERLAEILSRIGPKKVTREWKIDHWVIQEVAKRLGAK